MSDLSKRVAVRWIQANKIDTTETAQRVESGTKVIVKLRWTEPDDGDYLIEFPGRDLSDLLEVQKWTMDQAGEEYGHTIPSMIVKEVPGKMLGKPADAWDNLATNLRYSIGEEIYRAGNCPVFSRHHIKRS